MARYILYVFVYLYTELKTDSPIQNCIPGNLFKHKQASHIQRGINSTAEAFSRFNNVNESARPTKLAS